MKPTYIGFTSTNTYAVVIFMDLTGVFNGGRSFKKDCNNEIELQETLKNWSSFHSDVVYKGGI